MKHITSVLLSTVVGVGLLSAVSAADLIVEEPAVVEPVVVIDDWTGGYVGAFVGGAWGTVDVFYDDPWDDFEDEFSAEGWLVGIQAGANYQMDSFVIGVEGDIAWSDITGDSGDLSEDIITTDGSWIATLRGRAGIAFESVMFYATAGLSAAGLNHTVFDDGFPDDFVDPLDDGSRIGWVAGVGAAVMVADNVSIQGDLLFHDFGEEEIELENGSFINDSITLTTAKIGVNFHF